MIPEIRPLMTDTVQHWHKPVRDKFGNATKSTATDHVARVIYYNGDIISPHTKERIGNARAAVWLIDHPRQIALGDIFELPDGQTLRVTGTETRTARGGTLSKVFLT